MNFFDCFMYNNEETLLDLRFQTLSKYVRKFVLVESEFDHQGNHKDKLFNIDDYKKYKDKIISLKINNFPSNLNGSWERENFQRNYLSKAIENLQDDDYIIISDVDEIPNLGKIKNIEKNKFTAFKQSNYCYKFNMKNITYPDWYGSKICKKKYLKSPQWLRNQKVKNYSLFKFFKIKWNIIDNGGWHFSFLMYPEEIKKKIKSFAHDEFNKTKYLDVDRINKSIIEGLDLFDRNQQYIRVNLDKTFPKSIFDNKKKYQDWIL